MTEIQILKALIKYAYVKHYGDRRDIFNAYDTYQFPDVEKLIKIILINQPEGNLRWRFNQVFPEEAAKIFGRQTCIFPAEGMSTDFLEKQNPKIDNEGIQENTSNSLSILGQNYPKVKPEDQFDQRRTTKNTSIANSSVIQSGSSRLPSLIQEKFISNSGDHLKDNFGYKISQDDEIKDRTIFITGLIKGEIEDFDLNGLFEEKHENNSGNHYSYNFLDLT